jgi:predicted transcriptional regulator
MQPSSLERKLMPAIPVPKCKGLQDTQIEKTMQQNAALTLLDGAPATMADHMIYVTLSFIPVPKT